MFFIMEPLPHIHACHVLGIHEVDDQRSHTFLASRLRFEDLGPVCFASAV